MVAAKQIALREACILEGPAHRAKKHPALAAQKTKFANTEGLLRAGSDRHRTPVKSAQ